MTTNEILQKLIDEKYEVHIIPDWVVDGDTCVIIHLKGKRNEKYVAGKCAVKKLIKEICGEK